MPPLTVRSIQWPHWSGDARLNEALRLTRYAAPDACAVIGGNFNSLYPDCKTHPAEFEPDWTQLPPNKRHHKTPADGISNTEARIWAKAHDLEVKDRGRVPADVLAQYRAATGR